MNLTSATRLRIASLTVVAALIAGIGTFTSFNTYHNDISHIDSSITDVVSVIEANPNQAIGAALFQIENQSFDLVIMLHSYDGRATLVRDSSSQLSKAIRVSDIASGTSHFVLQHSRDGRTYRYETIEILGGDSLFIAGESTEAHSTFVNNIRITIATSLFAILIAFLILSFYIRRVRRRDDAAALSRMQEFLGDASHELRTPLTVVKGYVEMLSKNQISAPEDRDRAFSRVGSEIKRMESLIHDLLLLAELGESASAESEKVNLSEIIQAHSADFETLNTQREVSINIEKNILIEGESDYIVRFIQNALTNITRHTPMDAPVAVSLSARGKRAILIIEDGGPGLPEGSYRNQVRAFNRFDKARARDKGGSGLGMSIMAGVIEKLGGSLTLRKSALGGLAVEADLPVTSDDYE